MVSRKPNADWSALQVPARLFAAWRRLLGTIALYVRDAVSSQSGRRRGASHSHSRGLFEGPAAIAIGLACLIGGGLLGIALAPPGPPSVAEAIAAITSLAWAGARLAIMRQSSPQSAKGRRAITNAWAIGLAPWLFGVSAPLRLVAWLASALITWVVCGNRGVEAAVARRAILSAWGTQAGIVATIYLLRNLAVLLLAL